MKPNPLIPLGISFLILLQALFSSCTIQKNIVKKGESLTEQKILHSLTPGKKYKFWYKGQSVYDKVKITGVDSTTIKGFYKNYNHTGKSKAFELTPHEILATTEKICTITFSPVLTIILITGVGGVILIIPNLADPSGMTF